MEVRGRMREGERERDERREERGEAQGPVLSTPNNTEIIRNIGS